ncbi:uncharacterized protein LOC144451782 [Glandiceps talaboti]
MITANLATWLFLCGMFILTTSEIDTPIGHNEPLGGHRPPDVPIDETELAPDPKTFWTDYVSQGKPLIVRGALKHSPAFHLWNGKYLKENYGELEVRLEGKVEKGFGSPIPVGEKGLGRDTISNFIDTYKETNKYIVSQLPEPMYKDVMVVPSMQCGSFKESLVEIDLWMSSGNSKSILHKDAFNTWNCLLSGTKIWKMVDNKYERLIYKAWEPEKAIGGYSTINTTKVDLLSHPMVQKVRWSNLTINAGDCLYLPRSYYHQVTSFGDPNIAVALLFSRMTKFNDTGCDAADLKYTPLSEMLVTWNWAGHGNMTMGHMDHVGVRDNLQKTAQILGKVTAQQIMDEIIINEPEGSIDKIRKLTEETFAVLDKDKKGYLTEEDTKALDVETLRKFILTIEDVEPSNTEYFEYYHIPLEAIEELTILLLSKKEKVTKNTFIKSYMDTFYGSEEKALELFTKLCDGKDHFTLADFDERFETATENWRLWDVVDPQDEDPEIHETVLPQREQLLLFRDDVQYELKQKQQELMNELIAEETDDKMKTLLIETLESSFDNIHEDMGRDEL